MCDKILKIVVRANNITLLAPNPRLLTNAERQKRPRRPGGSKDYGAATDYKETSAFNVFLSLFVRTATDFNRKYFVK